MNENLFDITVEGEKIYGILHIPETTSLYDGNKVVIFLHGWAGYRAGPHDLFVKIARYLTTRGYYCVRFDFRGRGYSQGNKGNMTNYRMLNDLDAIIGYVDKTLNPVKKILLGICSGAKLALYYAKEGRNLINGIVALSTPVLRTQEVNVQLAFNLTKNMLQAYTEKLFRFQTWRKLQAGEINISSVIKNIVTPFLFKLKYSISNKKKKLSITPNVQRSFRNFRGEMLLIHGEKDPETHLALEQIEKLLLCNDIIYETCIIKGANHSFYAVSWEKEIIGILEKWLNLRYSAV